MSIGISKATLVMLLVLLPMAAVQAGSTTRVSVDSAGSQANGNIAEFKVALSADGRFVAFDSFASNLVEGDTNGEPGLFTGSDVFVHDRQTGTTTRVSVGSAGQQGNGPSSSPALSADGRFVAFTSGASNLVEDDTNGSPDVFLHDRQTGTTTRISVNSAGGQAESDSYYPAISADGRFVAFVSEARNLVQGDTNPSRDIFVHDRLTGTTTRVSVNSAGEQADSDSYYSAISADGRFVAFMSEADNLVQGDTNGSRDIFVHDRQTGTTTRVNVNSTGEQANSDSYYPPAISADGRFVTFPSNASNLVTNDTNGAVDVFVHQVPCGADADCDGVPDDQDNCIDVHNGHLIPDAGGHSQRDNDGDGYGNACDPDLNNDGRVTAQDYQLLRSRMSTADPNADLDGDGVVTSADYRILRSFLNQVPGPSALHGEGRAGPATQPGR